MSITYIEEPDALQHNVMFGIIDGIYYHHVSAKYELNREVRAPFAEEGARPFVSTQLHDTGINDLLIADIATRLSVDKDKVQLETVCFDQWERDDDRIAAEINEFVEHKRLYSAGGLEEVHLFGSYYLIAGVTHIGKSLVHYRSTPLHSLDETNGRAAVDRNKGDLVIISRFNNAFFNPAEGAAADAVKAFLLDYASRT